MPSLTRAEAGARAAAIEVTHYAINLDLTGADGGAPTFRSRTLITFTARRPDGIFVDVKAEAVTSASLNGVALDTGLVDDGRLDVPAVMGENTLVIDATMRYSGDGEGLHRHVDPADGETYLYAMSFLDAGPRWFASFDQPDLKATYDVAVRCPQQWTVLGNGAARENAPGEWTLATTQPLATYFVTLVAGPYHSVVQDHDGVTFGLHARASLAEHLEREAPEMLAVTKNAFDRYQQLFGIRYPFGDYHQAFVPDFNAGAMENPGCVTLRDQYVFSSATTKGERGVRANTIIHEMAHMWFGDLVTMTWWDDLWLNESFAEYMAHRVCGETTDYAAWSEFGIGRKDWGYVADQSPSTHPVAGNGSADAASALADFDGISYAKGAAVLRQLATFLGDEVFFGGLRNYFRDHAFGNAEFSDLIGSWEEAGGSGVTEWARQWLRTAGLDTLTATIDTDAVTVWRTPPDDTDRIHAVTVEVLAADGSSVSEHALTLGSVAVSVPSPPGAIIAVPDARDDTWAKIRFGDWEPVGGVLPLIADPLTRVVVYNAFRDGVRSADLDPSFALTTLLRAADVETDEYVLAALLGFASQTLAGAYTPPVHRPARMAQISEAASRRLAGAEPGSDVQLVAARAIIRSTRTADRLSRWLLGTDLPAGLSLDAELRWSMVERLATLGALDAAGVDDELARDRTASGRVHAARARALVPNPTAKADAWRLLTQPSQLGAYELYATADGFFHPEQDELTRPYVERFFAEIPATAEFRGGWSLARIVLLGYPTASADRATRELARQTIADPLTDERVRRSLVDATDGLSRAVASLERFAAS